MKRSLYIIAASILLSLTVFVPTPSEAAIRYNLGSSGFTIDSGATTAAYSQTATELRFNGSLALGDTIGGLFVVGTYDFSGVPLLGAFPLKLSISGANPDISFSVELFDDTFNSINVYSGSTTGATSSPTDILASLAVPGTGNFTSVSGLQLTFEGSGAVDMTFHPVNIPEPSTYVLVLMAGAGAIFWARQRK
jgi:hypothetical protein